MDEGTTKLLMKKVKKHRKWTEGVFINPIYWKVNGKPYYMAGYTKNNEAVGTAYLTLGEEVREEVLEAQSNLALFADLCANIFQIGEARLKVESAYYINPLNIAVSTDDRKVMQGREAFAKLWGIQQKFNRLVKDFKHYYNYDVLPRGQIVETDVARVLETANQVNMHQYMTLTTLLDKNEEIRAFANFLAADQEGRELAADQLDFVKGVTENKEVIRHSLANLNIIEDENLEKMERLNYKYSAEKNKKIIEEQRRFIRYPKWRENE